MNRKEFLRNIGLISIGAVLAPTVLMEMNKVDPLFNINYTTKTITYTGGEKGFDIYELYQYLQDTWDNDVLAANFPFPLKAI